MKTEELIRDINNASKSSCEVELKSHFLLGNTNEFDNFKPNLVSLEFCSDFEAFKVACCHYVGYEVQKENEEEAFRIWKKLSDKGESNSLLEYSVVLFSRGEIKEGFSCLLKASKAGNNTAIFRIALCYLHGIYVAKDDEKGSKLMQLLAKKNHPDALYFMSILHSVGTDSVPKDEQKSKEYLLKSVKLGSKFGQTEYGFSTFISSSDVDEKKKALALIQESADIGDPRAQTILAIIYAQGELGVVKRDEETSKMNLALAYDTGYLPAVKIVKELKNSSNSNN